MQQFYFATGLFEPFVVNGYILKANNTLNILRKIYSTSISNIQDAKLVSNVLILLKINYSVEVSNKRLHTLMYIKDTLC